MSGYVEVAVSGTTLKIDRLYTYAVPDDLAEFAAAGARVAVPFGRASKPRMGIILRTGTEAAGLTGIKELLDIEREPLLNGELMNLIMLLKESTVCTYDEALSAIIPKYSRLVTDVRDEEVHVRQESTAHLERIYTRTGTPSPPRLTVKQQRVVDLLEQPLSYKEIYNKTGISKAVVTGLLGRGLIETGYRRRQNPLYIGYGTAVDFTLSQEQQLAYERISCFIEEGRKDTTLLYGVTGSGKTLIYFKLIQDTVEKGKTALLLVPEIALATQIISRCKNLLGEKAAIIHSNLSYTERQLEWMRIKNGECSLVVGTRSGVFAPLKNIGIIIIDEEQEGTYLSEQSPRYSTFSIAAARAKYHNAHLLLSSATPSIETYHYAVTGRYNFVKLLKRYMDMPLPEVRVADMRDELLNGNTFNISQYLKQEIDRRLKKKEQVILLLNRRGYRTVSICPSCKEVVKCRSCDVTLVYHKQTNRHVCHYCDRSWDAIQYCERCGAELRHTGVGTQMVEEELSILFPSARIARIDMDSITGKNTLETKLTEFSKGETDIIIGTQMVAKGLDFKEVTLVGVLCIDQTMLLPGFRANERAFSLLTQVIGRSGRGEKKGEAVVQTIDPFNRIITLAAEQDYQAFYEREIISRKAHLYPPFCVISSVMITGNDLKVTGNAADLFLSLFKEILEEREHTVPVRVLGPVPARVSYISNKFRFRIVFKNRGDSEFRDVIRKTVERFYSNKAAGDTHVAVSFYDDGEI